jgi:hypothetical protein
MSQSTQKSGCALPGNCDEFVMSRRSARVYPRLCPTNDAVSVEALLILIEIPAHLSFSHPSEGYCWGIETQPKSAIP